MEIPEKKLQVSKEQEKVIRKIIEVMVPLPPKVTQTIFTRNEVGGIEEIVLEFTSGEALFCIAFKEDRTATFWVWGAKTAVQESGLRRTLMPAYNLILEVVRSGADKLYSDVSTQNHPRRTPTP